MTALGVSAKYIIRPSGLKESPFEQQISVRSVCTERSKSRRHNEEIGLPPPSSNPPARNRPCRSVTPSLRRVVGKRGSNFSISWRWPVWGSQKANPLANAATIPPLSHGAKEPIRSGALTTLISPDESSVHSSLCSISVHSSKPAPARGLTTRTAEWEKEVLNLTAQEGVDQIL